MTERNGRAVFAALRRTNKDLSFIRQGFDYWKSKFSVRPDLPVEEFVSSLESHLGLEREQRRTLAVSLFAALSREADQLPAIPNVLLQGAAAESDIKLETEVIEAERRSEAEVIFHTVLVEVGTLGTRTGRNTRSLVLDELNHMDMPNRHRNNLAQWISAGMRDLKLPSMSEPSDMQELVHNLYVALCEVLGPVQSDRILDAAIQAASQRPESAVFSPDKLI